MKQTAGGTTANRKREAKWWAATLLVSFLLALYSLRDAHVRIDSRPSIRELRDECLLHAEEIPFWTSDGYTCLRLTSRTFLFFDQWAVALLLCSAPLVVRRSYLQAQIRGSPDGPWLWRDTTGFILGILPWFIAYALVPTKAFWPHFLATAGIGGAWWLSGYLARHRPPPPVRRQKAAAVTPASRPAAIGISNSRALVSLPFAPVLRTIPIPPGPFLVKDEDGPAASPLWERLLGEKDKAMGSQTELYLPYSFELSYPVTVIEYLLCCWHGGVDSVAQGGATRSHHSQEFTAAHAKRLLLAWPLYKLARRRLNRALRPYYRAGSHLRCRESWLFADTALTEMTWAREQALREVRRQQCWLENPVINVTQEYAYQYCCWLSYKTARHCRLPTELEFLRAVWYLERECGWNMLGILGRNWYWTGDWYAELPSYAAGHTPARLPMRTTRYPYAALKSVHISPYERGAAVPWMRAANHGLLYVCERI